MTNFLHQLYVAYIEWKGRRKDLCGQERRFLHRWVARVHPELVAACGGGAQFRQQCREMQRGGQAPRSNNIGLGTLEKHSEALVARYLALPADQRGTFADFIESVRRRCKSEAALRKLLAQ